MAANNITVKFLITYHKIVYCILILFDFIIVCIIIFDNLFGIRHYLVFAWFIYVLSFGL